MRIYMHFIFKVILSVSFILNWDFALFASHPKTRKFTVVGYKSTRIGSKREFNQLLYSLLGNSLYWPALNQISMSTNSIERSWLELIGKEPIPAYTLRQLKALVTPTVPASYILLVEPGREGLFIYDPTNTSPDDGALVVVTANDKRYKRVLIDNRITPQMFGAIPDDTIDDGAALLAWINCSGSYEHYLTAGTFISGNALVRTNKKGFTLKGAGQGKSFIQFKNDTDGIKVANILGNGAYGQITMSDFEITSTGKKTGGREALYINSEHEQKPGPTISNIMIRAIGNSTNQWTTGLRYHNTSGSNTYGLSIFGVDLLVTTALIFSTDANRVSVEHNVTNFKFQTVKKGVSLDTPPTGTRTIEGILFTDGNIVGAMQGVVGITAIRQRSPYIGFTNIHINTFGGEAIYLDGYVQLVFSKCSFYSNISHTGVVPARSVYIANSIFCKGDFDLYLTGDLPAGAEFKGKGTGLDMRINGSHDSPKTYFVKQDATFPGTLDVSRIWTGTKGGPPVDKLIVEGGRGVASVMSTAERPAEGSVMRYDKESGNYRPVLPHVANISEPKHVTESSTIDATLFDVVSVENGNAPVTITIDNTNIVKGQKVWIKRYNEFSKGPIIVQSIAPKYNFFQDLDGGYKQYITMPNGMTPLSWYYNGSIFELISGGYTTNNTATNATNGDNNGLLKYIHLSGTPSISVGLGAGKSAVASIRSGDNDEAHQVTVTTGAAPRVGTLVAITFAKAYTKPPVVVFSLAEGIVPSGITILANASNVNSYFMYVSGALPPNARYKWNVHVKE